MNRFLCAWLSLFSLFVFIPLSLVALPLNIKLNESELRAINDSVGVAAGASYAENLYPLGGYQGFRISLLTKLISLPELRQFSANLNNFSDLTQYEIIIAKGLFYNIDIWGGFGPKTGNPGILYSGGIRWMAWESHQQPLSAGIIFSVRSSNLANQISIFHQTTDVYLNYYFQNVFAYFCFGLAMSNTEFVGGPSGITISGQTETLYRSVGRPLFGVGYQIQKTWEMGFELGYVANFFAAFKMSRLF